MYYCLNNYVQSVAKLKKIGRCLKNENILSAQIMLRLLAGVAEY